MLIFNEAFKTWNYLLKVNMTSTEIMLNSSKTITQRMMLLSDYSTSYEEAGKEICSMRQEKVNVVIDSASAIMDGYIHLGNEWLKANTSCFSPLATKDKPSPQMNYWSMLENNSLEVIKMTNATLSVLDKALKPIHSRTADNAKRLA